MKLKDLKRALELYPDAQPRFALPDGRHIPAHFHVTEVGHVAKRFIDCGGKVHDRTDTCLLQTWVADDYDHRLTAGRFGRILELGARVLPHDEMEVEVEYDSGVATQYPIVSAEFTGEHIDFQLGEKHTTCLARDRRGAGEECCGSSVAKEPALACCA